MLKPCCPRSFILDLNKSCQPFSWKGRHKHVPTAESVMQSPIGFFDEFLAMPKGLAGPVPQYKLTHDLWTN